MVSEFHLLVVYVGVGGGRVAAQLRRVWIEAKLDQLIGG